VACYRDALKLFLDFAGQRLHVVPTALQLSDITPALILAFLDQRLRLSGVSMNWREKLDQEETN